MSIKSWTVFTAFYRGHPFCLLVLPGFKLNSARQDGKWEQSRKVACLMCDIDERLGCVFNQPSSMEESDQSFWDTKSISSPSRLFTRTCRALLSLQHRRDTLTTCTHTPRPYLTNPLVPQHPYSICSISWNCHSVCRCRESSSSSSRWFKLSVSVPSMETLWGQSSIPSPVQPAKVLHLHQLKKYVDSFTLCRSKSPDKKNT